MNNSKNIGLSTGCYQFILAHPVASFCLYSSDGDIYHYRELKEGANSLKINVHESDNFTPSCACKYMRIGDIEKSGENIELPTAERFRLRPVVVKYNPNLSGTPARIFTNKMPAVIEVGKDFYSYPKQIRLFILLHEYGHLFYGTEWKVDRFALKMFLGQGFNESQAFYALSKVLHPSGQGLDRINRIFNTIKQDYDNPEIQ